jgi:hypothetical protein
MVLLASHAPTPPNSFAFFPFFFLLFVDRFIHLGIQSLTNQLVLRMLLDAAERKHVMPLTKPLVAAELTHATPLTKPLVAAE